MSVFTIEEGRHNNTYLRFKAHADPCQDNVDVRTRPPGSHYTASSTNISCFMSCHYPVNPTTGKLV